MSEVRLAGIHRLWFGGAFLLGIAYLVLVPPLQTCDEDGHWLDAHRLSGPRDLTPMNRRAAHALVHSVSLNRYLAERVRV